ncbi:MAG: hypothetical protein HUU20_02495 [Pirellulales bacterium]|nr:hypothetical protein [Pirellulales bacterium]
MNLSTRQPMQHARAWTWAALAAAVLTAPPAPAFGQAVWELTPYRIRVFLAMDHSPELTEQLEEDLRTDLSHQADARIGAAWNVDFAPVPAPLERAMAADWSKITVDVVPKDDLELDKILLLKVSADLAGYHVAGRELDVRTRTWNTVVRATALHPARLCDTAFGVMCKAFAPLARVEEVEKTSVLLRLRAAALAPRDPNCLRTQPGALLMPVVRYNNREGKFAKATPIPWTYFHIEEVAGAELKCRLYTGLRSPLSGRRRGRVEQLAVTVIPPNRETRLELRSRTDAKKPLVGYEIYQQKLGSKEADRIGRTDWRGMLVVGPAGPPLRVLLVKSGSILLARLPIVPGLETEITAPVPDDDQRLEAEGFVNGFQEELVDLVTRREVLVARIRSRIQAGKLNEAEALLSELRLMKNREEFRRDLDREQKKIFSEDPVVQRRIDTLFSDTHKLLQRYLDPAQVEQLVRELADARRSADAGKA